MKYIFYLIFGTFFLTSINSCKKTDNNPISTPIVMNLHQMLDTNGRKPYIYISFETGMYPTLNYSLDYKTSVDGNNVYVEFTNVTNPGMGLTMMGPAKGYILLGALNSGNYQLNFKNGSATYRPMLVVTDSNFSVLGAGTSGMSFKTTTLNKVPANTIWGHITSSAARLPSVDSVISALEAMGAQTYSGPIGNYELYTISPGMIPDTGYDEPKARNFIYHYTGNCANIDSLVKRYRYVPLSELYVMVYASNGRSYLSGQH